MTSLFSKFDTAYCPTCRRLVSVMAGEKDCPNCRDPLPKPATVHDEPNRMPDVK